MLENYKDNVLNRLDRALQTQDRADIETLLQNCDVTELLSQDTISLARKNQQKALIIFLCSLAIDNGIEADRAEFWLNIYQTINKRKNTPYVESLDPKNIVAIVIDKIISGVRLNDTELNNLNDNNEAYIDAVEILIDNNYKNIAIEMLDNLKQHENRQWEAILKKLNNRHPDLSELIQIKSNTKKISENEFLPFFEIIISGINLNKHLDKCLESINLQNYEHYRIHILSDNDPASVIGDPFKVKEKYGLKNNPIIFCAKTQQGKADIIYTHFQKFLFKDNSIALILDGDDMLYRRSALDTIAKTYIAENPDACWSTYIRSDNILGHSAPLIKGYHHRQQGWKSSHCFTFKAKLLQKVPRDYILDKNGHPVMQACDIAIALPILDIAKKTSFIPEALYYYQVGNPESHHNQKDGFGLSSKRQVETANYIYSKKPLTIN